MTKDQLLEALASKSGLSKSAVNGVMQSFSEVVNDSLKRGERVLVAGVGVFDVARWKARRARDPQSGKLIDIPSMKIPRFRASVGLKGSVRK